jgi:hypothetical protein
MNYWIFQGRPGAYDFSTAIENNLIEEWNVKAHGKKIKKGDKAIIGLLEGN